MASHRLPNYLRVHRKRLGLSQTEVGFLLGCRDASQTSRYEHFSCTPSLCTALALAVIMRVSLHELFSGEYQKVEKAISERARRLEERLSTDNPDGPTSRKLALLRMIKSPEDKRS